MEWKGRVVLITGGGNGIGRALALRIATEQPQALYVVDRDEAGARRTAADTAGIACPCDVTREAELAAVVEQIVADEGRIDVVLSNAGITTKGGFEVPDADWNRLWAVNVMAHVYLARAAIPRMVQNGGGVFVITASAAGLLTEIGSAAYSVTKHGAVALAEWLAVHYRDQGLQVACLCPAGVATDFLDLQDPVHQFLNGTAVTAEQVADAVLEGLQQDEFLILPQEIVGEMFQFKTQNYDRWLQNFARLNQRLKQKSTRRARSAPTAPESSE